MKTNKLLLTTTIIASLGSTSMAATTNSYGVQVLGDLNKVNYLTNSNVVGSSNEVSGKDNVVIGNSNKVAGHSAIAIGNNIYAKAQTSANFTSLWPEGKGAITIGDHTKVTQEANTAIGYLAQSYGDASVAIGAYSMAFDDVHKVDSKYAGVATNQGVFSIGSSYPSIFDKGTTPAEKFRVFTRQLQNVGAGAISATSTDAVNGSQLHAVIEAVNEVAANDKDTITTVMAGTNTTVTNDGNHNYTVSVNKDLNNMNSVNLNNVAGTERARLEASKVHFFNDNTSTNTAVTANGVAIENTDNLDQVNYSINGMTASGSNHTVRFTTDGITAGNQIINGVKAGTADTDAVNVSQLNNAVSNISNNYGALTNKVNKNHNEAKRGIAGTAALAALHPLDFDPDHKLDVMAGYGHFHNANSVALGMAYRPNEDLMFTVGSTVGNGDTVVNAGISYKVGAKSGVSRSKVSVAKDVADMKREMEAMKAQNAKITAILNAVLGADLPEDQTNMFPDVPANHWAYEAVNDMAKRGLVIGYEDGQFKGDRTMTRYEFAMIVERAIQKAKELNTSIDGRLVDEFKPELLRFEIQKNGSLERVHTMKSNKEIQRDSYGTIITK